MAGIKPIHKLKASTLVEALIAMVIIMGAFALGTSVFMTVFSSGQSQQHINGEIVLSNIVNESYVNNRFLDELIEVDDLQIEKTIEKTDEGNALIMTCTAYDVTGKLIAERRDVVY